MHMLSFAYKVCIRIELKEGELMSALEYIVKTHKKTSREAAEQIGVAPQTFNDWVKGRREIPKKRLKQLSKLFSVEEQLFSKQENEMTEIDKLKIYLSYLSKVNTFQYNPDVDEFPHYSHAVQIRQTNILIENHNLMSDIKKLLDGGGFFEDENYSKKAVLNYYIFRKVTDILLDGDNDSKVLNDLKELLNIK